MAGTLSRSEVWGRAWPLIVANATSPLLGLADTAVLGHSGQAVDLAAIALGALIFNFAYWSFGFLRMSTTGFVAQAAGRGDSEALALSVARPLWMGALVGILLYCFQAGIEWGAFELLSAGKAEEAAASSYFRARIIGAPASLASLAGFGFLIGLGRSRQLLLVQLLTNGLNILLDVLFVAYFSWGAAGVGWGTALSEWVGVFVTFRLIVGELRLRSAAWPSRARLLESEGLKQTLRANTDIMVRTLAMILSFSFFVNQASRWGAEPLAANHILMQFIAFSAFFLDGFANVAEAEVGQAWGRRDRVRFLRALRLTTEAAGICAVCLAAGIVLWGEFAVSSLTSLQAVRAIAVRHLDQVGVYVLLSFVAFQLDGVFIGAQWTRAMRNSAILCLVVFVGSWWILSSTESNRLLWWCFVAYVSARGLTLAVMLRKQLSIEN